MKDLLLEHLIKYPYMEVQDLVKLIYQNEFAGGHMILDEKSSLKRLQTERETLKEVSSFEMDLFEDIGNGLYRLHLQPLKQTCLSLETLNYFFICTARETKGTITSFEEKLRDLLHYCKYHELPFSYTEVSTYLEHYKKRGYPSVSHSDTFHKHYQPAYRIVKKDFITYFKLFCSIDDLTRNNQVAHIAIDGNSGSGKSSLAFLLESVYDCNVFHMDDFFLRPEQKTIARKNEIGGNIDYLRFKEEVIDNLDKQTAFTYQIYDCSVGRLTEYVNVTPKKVNIIEGVYSLHPHFRAIYQLKVFLTIDPVRQSERILKRNGPYLHQRFITEWIPLENAYFSGLQIENLADILFIAQHS